MIALIFILSEALSQTVLLSSTLHRLIYRRHRYRNNIFELYTDQSCILQFTFSEMFCTRVEIDRNICLWSNVAAKTEIIFRTFCSQISILNHVKLLLALREEECAAKICVMFSRCSFALSAAPFITSLLKIRPALRYLSR